MGEKLRISVVVGAAVLLRWCVTYHPYSGQGKPPMYGDYEAQRHWQEITTNLPIEAWYTNNSDNDLQYWGLDYPPLTAYHSLLMGRIAAIVEPKYVELHRSRGFESDAHKYFMRLSVLVVDIIVYIPAMIYFVYKATVADCTSAQQPERSALFDFKKHDYILATALLYPGIVLIDHGHFQYNCVSLGLFLAAVAFLLRNSTIVASFFFVLALNYKQMELYHALPFFFYILGNNTPNKRKPLLSCLRSLICVSLTVILTFIIIWAPFCLKWDLFTDVLTRLFPFDRGVFEDKVANVWCTLNVFYKFRQIFTNVQLARVCLLVTTIAVMPSCLNLYLKPNREKFVVSLINCALGFYLFSFQVHEKSILLAAIPVVMYFHRDPLPCFWFLIISTFSMFPLLLKDGLCLAYFSSSLFYTLSVYIMWPREFVNQTVREKESSGKGRTKAHKETSIIQRKSRVKQSGRTRSGDFKGWPRRYYEKIHNLFTRDFLTSRISLFGVSMIGVILLSVASIVVEPPEKYPDLLPLLVSTYCCAHFTAFFVYFNYKQIYALQKNSGKAKPH